MSPTQTWLMPSGGKHSSSTFGLKPRECRLSVVRGRYDLGWIAISSISRSKRATRPTPQHLLRDDNSERYDVLHSVACVPRRSLESVASTPHPPPRGNLGFLVATRSNVSDVLPAPRTAWRSQNLLAANVRSRHTPVLRFLAENGQGFF